MSKPKVNLTEYAACLLEASEPGTSYPQIVTIDRRGDVEVGFYDRSAQRGAWHNGAYASIVLQERPVTDGEEWTAEEYVKCFSGDLHRDIADALEEADDEDDE